MVTAINRRLCTSIRGIRCDSYASESGTLGDFFVRDSQFKVMMTAPSQADHKNSYYGRKFNTCLGGTSHSSVEVKPNPGLVSETHNRRDRIYWIFHELRAFEIGNEALINLASCQRSPCRRIAPKAR